MRTSLADVQALAALLSDFPKPWFVAGGWAIDLFVGAATRPHEDLEVAVLRRDQGALRAYLRGWTLQKVEHEAWVSWEEDEWLELPVFQIQAQRMDGDPATFEIFLNDTAGDIWSFRHIPHVTRLISDIGFISPFGIPTIAPELQLLYKAKRHRPKDEHDFRQACNHLSAEQRVWLATALQAHYPKDPWIAELERCA
jgi:hypothetical protein